MDMLDPVMIEEFLKQERENSHKETELRIHIPSPPPYEPLPEISEESEAIIISMW